MFRYTFIKYLRQPFLYFYIFLHLKCILILLVTFNNFNFKSVYHKKYTTEVSTSEIKNFRKKSISEAFDLSSGINSKHLGLNEHILLHSKSKSLKTLQQKAKWTFL